MSSNAPRPGRIQTNNESNAQTSADNTSPPPPSGTPNSFGYQGDPAVATTAYGFAPGYSPYGNPLGSWSFEQHGYQAQPGQHAMPMSMPMQMPMQLPMHIAPHATMPLGMTQPPATQQFHTSRFHTSSTPQRGDLRAAEVQSDGYSPPSPPSGRRSQSFKPSERDPIVAPSKASGGIPNPTEAYLSQTLRPSHRLDEAKSLLLVIDLNGTLLYRPERSRPKHFVPRPHAAEFLKYVTRTFWVVIWSSARPENVQSMIARLLPKYNTFAKNGFAPDNESALVAVWSRKNFGLSPTDYNRRVQCYKRLTTLWNNPAIARTHPEFNNPDPAARRRWDQSNTVLIDDGPEKARSEPWNLLPISEYAGDMGGKEDDMLPQVHDYINELAFQSDVSSYMRANPFRPSEEGWNPKAREGEANA